MTVGRGHPLPVQTSALVCLPRVWYPLIHRLAKGRPLCTSGVLWGVVYKGLGSWSSPGNSTGFVLMALLTSKRIHSPNGTLCNGNM